MGNPLSRQPLTLERLQKLLDPGRVFYRVAVDDALERGERAEILSLIEGAREVQAKYGSFDGLIEHLELAAKKAQH
jgi:hypothetical protein